MRTVVKYLSAVVGMFMIHTSPLTMANDTCHYRVVKVAENDTLTIRFGPDVKYRTMGFIPHNGSKIKLTGPELEIGQSKWAPIEYENVEGWVNFGYLEEDCQDDNAPVNHKVQTGETLFTLAKRYDATVEELAQWNKLQAPYDLPIGQSLRIIPPTRENCSYKVAKVREDDMLWIRAEASVKSPKVGAIPYDATAIIITGTEQSEGKTQWVPIKYKGLEGWVNRGYLREDC